ncbi:(S)-benzoin forming benzil reductase [Alkalihalophilus lindianensis]|uniref:(S)-benzoin forming benzil reductase n=1 Tax=Alkalihalophilus lindianensis TaxID=1630542 RepID=A0ABU3XDB5_9BACI|nr:(S)-benzoin forming benzil reductase [Alkalihalophilus lindianensis]MDV2685860.1 (S)-benzoin forming benzil reductase [Alkalihalophilus lindianensis]
MNYLIVTGASKGLGQEIVKTFASGNSHIISIARTENTDLQQYVSVKGGILSQLSFDLANIHEIDSLMKQVFDVINLKDATSIHLINNAGMVAPIKPIERCEPEEIIKNQHVNLLAPMLIISSFCKITSSLPIEKRIINVSSGAAKKPIYGWSSYGSAKAALDLFSQGAALDQQEANLPVNIISFHPGIMDTDMQEEIRSSSQEDFLNVETFQNYKKEGKLLPPQRVADVLFSLVSSEAFPNGQVVSVQDYL